MNRFFSIKHRLIAIIFAIALPFTSLQFAEGPVSTEKMTTTEKLTSDPAHAIISVTDHVAIINGKEVPYKATAGLLEQKNDKGEVKATLFYVSYSRTDSGDITKRPIAYCFNGGPGAASVWLHMGLLGPKRVNLSKDKLTIPPFSYIDNEYSLLDLVDLVFIDPVSTGYSRPTANEDKNQFHGVEEDIKSVAEFIRMFTTQNERWESPKFLIGESYGTTRAALLAEYMHDEMYMYLNGLILVSSVLDFQTIDKMERSNDLTYLLYLPSYTAAAWYHQKLPADLQKMTLYEVMRESKKFAVEEYSLALLRGDALDPEVHTNMVQKLANFSGLTPEFVDRMNLRVSVYVFMKELLKNENRVIGRFDSRLTGIDLNACSMTFDYDPAMDSALGIFTAAFNQYVRTDLNWKSSDEYRTLADVSPWNYGKSHNQFLNVGSSLKTAMSRNPLLQVFVASGFYDLATPQFATEYTFTHLGIDPTLRKNIEMGQYEAGHMMFTDMPSLRQLSSDLHGFVKRTLEPNRS